MGCSMSSGIEIGCSSVISEFHRGLHGDGSVSATAVFIGITVSDSNKARLRARQISGIKISLFEVFQDQW